MMFLRVKWELRIATKDSAASEVEMEFLERREWRGEIIAANSASTSDHGGEATFANCVWG